MVVERGASLSCRDDAAEFDETTAITQLSGERDEALAARVSARVEQAERSGKVFHSALLVVGEGGSACVRRSIAGALTAPRAVGAPLEELVIIAPTNASTELRGQLLQLTDELLFSARSSLPVRLCFAAAPEQEQRSGTFWCLSDDGDDSRRQ